MIQRLFFGAFILMVAVAGPAWAGQPGMSNDVIPEFSALYKVRASVASGELSMSLAKADDGSYVFRTLTRPRGLVRVFARGEIDEQSRLLFRDGGVVPLDYSLRDTISKNHDADYQFDWAAGVVSGIERGEEVGDELQSGMLNRAALYIALMQDLSQEKLPQSYVLFDRGRVKSFAIEELETEPVEVPFGRFEAVKLVRDSEGSRRSMYLWCAPELNYLPVQIDLYKGDKRISRAELKALTGLPGEPHGGAPEPVD